MKSLKKKLVSIKKSDTNAAEQHKYLEFKVKTQERRIDRAQSKIEKLVIQECQDDGDIDAPES